LYNKITVRQMHREFRLQAVTHSFNSFIHIRLITKTSRHAESNGDVRNSEL